MKKWIALCLAVLLCLALASCGSDGKTSSVSTSSSVAVGDICYFGAYEQDNDLTNGKEPIEWLVLDVQGDKALLLSKYGLDAKPYNTTYADVTWETCTLRKWLNDDFLKTAFSEDEQKAILTTEVDNSANDYPGQVDNILTSVIYDESLKNNRILVADDIGTVFLGTYQWFIKAFDSAGELRWENKIGIATQGMRYDAARKWLIVGSQDRNVYVLDATNGEILAVYPVKGVVNDIDYDEETGRLLVSTKAGETKANLQILDITNGTELNTYKLKLSAVSAQFSKDRNYCYYSYKGKIIKADFESEDGQPNKIGEVSLINKVASIAVVPTTGDVYAIDEDSNLYRFDENLNELFSVKLDSQGKGVSVGVSDDGRWVAAGTKLGDAFIVDSNGKVHFTTRFIDKEKQDDKTSQYFEVTQAYFCADVSYIASKTSQIFEFSTHKLETINLWSRLHKLSLIASIGLFVLTALMYDISFPRSRDMTRRFFIAIYKHRVAYLLLLPSIALILVFNYYNVVQAFYYAFTDWSKNTINMREVRFIGFNNFIEIFQDGYFLLGVKNLAIMMAASF